MILSSKSLILKQFGRMGNSFSKAGLKLCWLSICKTIRLNSSFSNRILFGFSRSSYKGKSSSSSFWGGSGFSMMISSRISKLLERRIVFLRFFLEALVKRRRIKWIRLRKSNRKSSEDFERVLRKVLFLINLRDFYLLHFFAFFSHFF